MVSSAFFFSFPPFSFSVEKPLPNLLLNRFSIAGMLGVIRRCDFWIVSDALAVGPLPIVSFIFIFALLDALASWLRTDILFFCLLLYQQLLCHSNGAIT